MSHKPKEDPSEIIKVCKRAKDALDKAEEAAFKADLEFKRARVNYQEALAKLWANV